MAIKDETVARESDAGAGAGFVIEPFTPNCGVVYESRAHVVMGVSPNNSYFNVARLTGLLGWLSATFARVDVVVPDSALVHTHLALGYVPERAAKKARGETAVLRNRVLRAWKAAGGPGPGHAVHLMSTLAASPVYQRLLERVRRVLATDDRLHKACLKMSRQVLAGRLGHAEPTPEQQELATDYLAAELPFFLDAAAIFDVPSSLCFYHRPVLLADLIFSGRTPLRPSPRQGYALIYPTSPPGAAGTGRAAITNGEAR